MQNKIVAVFFEAKIAAAAAAALLLVLRLLLQQQRKNVIAASFEAVAARGLAENRLLESS